MVSASKPSGENGSDMASTASPTSKVKSFVVSYPLTRSQVAWLKLQSKRVAEVSDRLFALEENRPLG
jgi:hypothetical protein